MRDRGRGGQHPRQPELCHSVKLPALLVKHSAGESDTKIRREAEGGRGSHFAGSGSFCLCALFMTIVITFRAELKNMQEFCKRLGGMIRGKLHGLFGADNLDSA